MEGKAVTNPEISFQEAEAEVVMVDVVEAEGGVKRTSFRYTLCLSRGPQGSVAKVQYITDKILACVDIYGAWGYVIYVTGKKTSFCGYLWC